LTVRHPSWTSHPLPASTFQMELGLYIIGNELSLF
jgi:hypothetical protein